jgi:hypothetical protein
VIDYFDFGRRFLSRLGTLQFHVILIRNQIRSDKDTALRQNSAEGALRERGFLCHGRK